MLDVNQTMSVQVRSTMTQALEVLDRFDSHLLSIYYELHIKELKTAYVLFFLKKTHFSSVLEFIDGLWYVGAFLYLFALVRILTAYFFTIYLFDWGA